MSLGVSNVSDYPYDAGKCGKGLGLMLHRVSPTAASPMRRLSPKTSQKEGGAGGGGVGGSLSKRVLLQGRGFRVLGRLARDFLSSPLYEPVSQP